MANTYQRSVAVKVSIKDVLQSQYIHSNEDNPSYLKWKIDIIRLNLMGVVIKKEKVGSITNILVEDGTGEIVIRLFEENNQLEELNVGDTILIVGKPREYNQERYVAPEIIKKINPLWLKVRSLEIPKSEKVEENKPIERPVQKKEEIVLPFEKITQLIKELDKGEGVLIEEIIEKSSISETEQVIEKMLANGDIFQNNPGKVKVL